MVGRGLDVVRIVLGTGPPARAFGCCKFVCLRMHTNRAGFFSNQMLLLF